MKTNKIKHITYEFTFDPEEAEHLYTIMNAFLGLEGFGGSKYLAAEILEEMENEN